MSKLEKIIINPQSSDAKEVSKWIQENGSVRGIISFDGTIVVADSWYWHHFEIILFLGIEDYYNGAFIINTEGNIEIINKTAPLHCAFSHYEEFLRELKYFLG